jgi:hypothetical protein
MSYSSSRASLLLSLMSVTSQMSVLALALLLLGGCTEDVGTSIRISLVYKDGWRMGDADVILSQADNTKLERRSSISHELLVLVPDALAGSVMPLEVWGVRQEERISHGSAVALVRKGETVEATIVLDRLPCGVFCDPDEVECEGGGVATCEEDADGCMQWSVPAMCPAEQPFCSSGVCGTVCANDCVAGQGTCTDATTQRACGEFDNDTCRDYGPSVKCTGAEVCYSGRCALPCAHGALTNTTTPGSAGAFSPTIAVDAAGTSHAIYSAGGTRQLRYAARGRSGNWPAAWDDIPGAVGENPSLAIDKAGGLHFVAGGGAVIYGYLPAGNMTWQVVSVESGVAIGASSSIAIADDGTVHIVYYRSADQTLRHGRKGTPWMLEDVGTNVGQRCDLAFAGTTLHVSSFDNVNNLWHSMLEAGGAWENVMITDLTGSALLSTASTSIAVDREGTVHVVYSDLVLGFDDLRYVYRSGGSWTSPAVIDAAGRATGAYPDLAIDPFDRLHVAYRTTATPELRYATKDAGMTSWALTPQPPSTSGVAPSIAIDPLGNVHILSAAASITETTRACQ